MLTKNMTFPAKYRDGSNRDVTLLAYDETHNAWHGYVTDRDGDLYLRRFNTDGKEIDWQGNPYPCNDDCDLRNPEAEHLAAYKALSGDRRGMVELLHQSIHEQGWDITGYRIARELFPDVPEERLNYWLDEVE